jgi:two-component system, cell cycle sensor histidine kinase and response regulator CckA
VADLYRELFERSADAILFIEGETFVDCNDAAVRMMRCRSRDELLSTHPSELSPEVQPDGRASFEKASEMIAIALERGSHRFEWEHMRADGEVFPVEVLLTAVGERLHVVWRDLSERKQLEAKLREAQKMEIVGRLAAGIAHDFNNLLVVVLGNADLLCATLHPDTTHAGLAEEIREAGERGGQLIKRLLALGRKQGYTPAPVELHTVLDELAGLIRRALGPLIHLEIEQSEAVTITSDRGQLEQAILNLATNAREAMPTGGRVTFRVGALDLGAEGRFAFLRVVDTGEGMDEATLARAAEPFFTTKATGTGLGLASVHNSVRQSGGFVRLSSAVGQGTTVGLYWPLDPTAAQNVAPRRSEERAAASLAGVRVLIVEDDDPVAGFVERVLSESGCVLARASHGEQALTVFEGQGGFDVVLSDVMMPVMDGPAMVAKLRQRGIAVPAVFMSGYTDDAIAAAGLEAEAVLLEKPFAPWELRRAIRRAASG